jgi:hypothetical protein
MQVSANKSVFLQSLTEKAATYAQQSCAWGKCSHATMGYGQS